MSLARAEEAVAEFVEMCLMGQEGRETEEEGREEEGGEGGGPSREGNRLGGNGGGAKEEGSVSAKGGGGGKAGSESDQEGNVALQVTRVDCSLGAVPGLRREDVYTLKFAALQYIELFKLV